MKPLWHLLFTTSILALCLRCAGAQVEPIRDEVGVERLTARLQEQHLSWDERKEIETKLKSADRRQILPAMYAVLAKFKEGGGGYAYGLNPYPRGHTIPWYDQVWLIASRVWDHHVRPRDWGNGDPELGHLLVPLLTTNLAGARRDLLLWAFWRPGAWVDSAEAPIAAILRGHQSETWERWKAAQALLRHKTNAYLAEIKRIAMDRREKPDLRQDLLMEVIRLPTGPKPPPAEFGTLDAAFALVRELEERKSGSGYWLASHLANILGISFKPDQKDPKYRDKGNLNALFFAQTSTNALAWWSTNRSIFANPSK